VLNPDKAGVVRRIFNMSTKGHGSRVIAATLNQEGIPAFSAGRKNFSGLWGFSTVRHILDSRTTLGEYQPHIFIDGKRTPDGDPIKGQFPAVVTEDEFYLAQAARSSRKTHGVTKNTVNFNVLAGIFNCFKCGSPMHLQGQRGRKYYKCSKTIKGLCDMGVISAPRSEAVFREVLAKVDSLSLVQDSSGSLQRSLQVLDGRIAEHKQRQDDAEAAHAEFPSRSTARLLSELEANILGLESERSTVAEQLITDRVINKHDFFEKLDLVTFEGRSAANNLLKRLGVAIVVIKFGRLNESYTISVNKTSSFMVMHENSDITVRSLDRDLIETLILQGDIDETIQQNLAQIADVRNEILATIVQRAITEIEKKQT
jgi:hypothetical protein